MAHNDKRSVVTDALETLGTIIDENQKRDAIHLAVEPVIAGEWLNPGDDVSLKDGAAFRGGTTLGIVDPFIKTKIGPGERFWLVVYPRKITSLRHVWEHPAFSDSPVTPVSASTAVDPVKLDAERYIREEADRLGLSYEEIMDGADNYQRYGEYMIDGGRWEGEGLADADKFWTAYEKVTDKEITGDRYSFFSCSC
jgi:hypothetical protein